MPHEGRGEQSVTVSLGSLWQRDHRTAVEGIEGVMSLWKRAHGAQRGGATRVEAVHDA